MRRPTRLACDCLLAMLAALMMAGCSPAYNWREVHGENVPFSVLLPAKPSTFSRSIDLNGLPVNMTMTAAEVDGITFAVGAAELNNAAQTRQALESMRTALLNNINGTPNTAALPGRAESTTTTLDVAATGVVRGQAMTLMARLIARDQRIYQVLIMAPNKNIPAEQAESFFTSFKPH